MTEQSVKDLYTVNRIGFDDVLDWVKHKHYARNVPPMNRTDLFGLFDRQNIMVGVCCYGSPANNNNVELGGFKMIELVRLVVNEGLPKNTLSYFVAQTFPFLDKPRILVSYADTGRSHHGYIYQALNWIYTGFGGGVDYYIDNNGQERHSRVMSDMRLVTPELTRDQICQKLGWKKVKGTYKHRYFYFVGDKAQRKEMQKVVLEKYPQKPYPKGENQRYDASYEPTVQLRLF